jgi:hypothetical protein
MHAALVASNIYSALAISVLILHALLWVIFGTLMTVGRPCLRWRHTGCLLWRPLTELLPFPFPLTVLEDWLEHNAGAGLNGGASDLKSDPA